MPRGTMSIPITKVAQLSLLCIAPWLTIVEVKSPTVPKNRTNPTVKVRPTTRPLKIFLPIFASSLDSKLTKYDR